MKSFLCFASVCAALGFSGAVAAQSQLPLDPVRLDALTEFRPGAPNWQVAGGLSGNPRVDKSLERTPGTGVLVNNPGPAGKAHLVTAWEHGDLELEFDFLLTPGSNSGVYLQGRYEVQLYDSWSRREMTVVDCGAIYERWDAARGAGKEGFEGHPPLANASRAPGLWQRLRVEFVAPRFDATGKKIRSARFAKVVLNGFTVQENVEVHGPTRSPLTNDERPLGPLMIQGDHGAIAVRNLAYKRFDADAQLPVEKLTYRLYSVSEPKVGDYEEQKLTKSGTVERLSHAAVEKTGKFALVFEGQLTAPRAGDYAFAVSSPGAVRLQIDGETVVQPLDNGGVPGTVRLTAGTHALRLDYVHTNGARPNLDVIAEGPGLAPHSLTGREPRSAPRPKSIVVQPTDRVLAQRSFVPFEPRKRLYAINVGTPAGVHFSYDFETSAILQVWRGGFVDTFEMWESRGYHQTARPVGPTLTLNAKPAVALIETTVGGGWPDQPESLASSQGYTLEPDGTPVFLGRLVNVEYRDRLAPAADGRSLTRSMNFKGELPSWSVWVLLAEADRIVAQPDGRGWIVGDREWYVDWPAGAKHRPIVRSTGGRQQLAVRLTKATLEAPLTYTLVW